MKKAPQDTFHESFRQEVKVSMFKLLFDDMDDLYNGRAKLHGGFLYLYFQQCHIIELLYDDIERR